MVGFNILLRHKIMTWAYSHASDHSCEVVQIGVMLELGFDISQMLKYTKGNLSGIAQKILALDESAAIDIGYCKKVDPAEAARLATQNGGTYIMLAMMSKEIQVAGKPVQKDHVAFVLDGPCDPVDGPRVGGGGLTLEELDKGWGLSNARIHFTQWKDVSYYMYCYRRKALQADEAV
jgi:hypothetical protein